MHITMTVSQPHRGWENPEWLIWDPCIFALINLNIRLLQGNCWSTWEGLRQSWESIWDNGYHYMHVLWVWLKILYLILIVWIVIVSTYDNKHYNWLLHLSSFYLICILMKFLSKISSLICYLILKKRVWLLMLIPILLPGEIRLYFFYPTYILIYK